MEPQPPNQPRSAGAGGKISTNRRRWRFNPYNRPPPPEAPPPEPKSANWLSAVVPASRKIASGAVKMLSSVFISDSSSSDEESVSEDDVNNDGDRDGHLNETIGLNSEAERKHVIKQLLSEETFSREECDMLVKIIHSRVLEHSSVDRVGMPIRSVLNVTPDHAVMEAKKFLEEKKAGRSPQSDVGHGSSGLYSTMIQHTESEAGSPADMAKSYMRERQPRASSSTGQFEERKYPASGAWNMQDEIRRLRSKATEEMIRPSSSSKVVPSLPAALPRSGEDLVTVAIPGDKVNTLSSSGDSKTLDRSAKMVAGADSDKGISASDTREGIEEPAVQQNSETQKANGVPPSPASLSEGGKGENQRHTRKGKARASHEKTTNDFPEDFRWELSSEVSVEVPTTHDSVNVDSGSQQSHEELSQEQSETEGKQGVAAKRGKRPVRIQPKRQTKAA